MNSKNFSEILELSKNYGGKYVVIEEDKPSYVLMDIKEYKKMASVSGNVPVEDMSKEELIEKINKDIALWHAGQGEDEKSADDHFLSNDFIDNNEKDEAQYLYKELEDDF